ncbi:hypothetical protein [Halomonas sp. C05BenzN]|uniref:hypothetical protein n=1 Tax=Halomonas sp. C05BenzN TaxID=3411041 RepID=UPI003B95175C
MPPPDQQKVQLFVSRDGKAQLEVALDQETAWLSLDQMTRLFDRDKSVISRHIGKVFKEGELDRDSVVAKNATTAADGKTYQVALDEALPAIGERKQTLIAMGRATELFGQLLGDGLGSPLATIEHFTLLAKEDGDA